MSFSVKIQNLLNMCCGNVHLPGMSELYAVGKSRSVQVQLRIFIYLFRMLVDRLSQESGGVRVVGDGVLGNLECKE